MPLERKLGVRVGTGVRGGAAPPQHLYLCAERPIFRGPSLRARFSVRMVLVFVALAGLAYIGFKYILQGAPEPRMANIVTLPGATISKFSLHGGNLGMIGIVLGGAVLALLIAYAVMSSNK